MEISKPFHLRINGLELSSDDDVVLPRPIVRLARELSEFLRDKEGVKLDVPVLSVYRGVNLRADDKLFGSVRHDITIVLPGRLGSEKNKTLSHYHNDFTPGLSYPEIYEVLSGIAHFILQKPPERGGPEVILVEAKEGEGVLIPPNYGHTAINAGSEVLVYSNLVCRAVDPALEEFRKRRGAAYYELYDGTLERNPNYEWNAELKRQAGDPSFAGTYERFRSNPNDFSYLCDPSLRWSSPP